MIRRFLSRLADEHVRHRYSLYRIILIKYLLTVIDIFSKFVWIVPLKRKTGQEVANAFSSILKERKRSKTWVDRGREFHNKDVQKLVELYSTENEEKILCD